MTISTTLTHRRRAQEGFVACRLSRSMGRGRIELSAWVPAGLAKSGLEVELRIGEGRWNGPWRVLSTGSWTNRPPQPRVVARAIVPRPAVGILASTRAGLRQSPVRAPRSHVRGTRVR